MPIEGQFILVIDPSPEAAARLNSRLRNAGLSVQVLHADSEHEARRLGREFRPVLLVHSADGCLPLPEAAALASELQTFFVVLADTETVTGRANDLLQHGGMLIDAGNDERLVAISRHLLGAGSAMRRQNEHQGDLDEIRGQLDLVLSSTTNPIAYFHEGLHVAANPAYLALMGVDNFAELAGTSLLEIVRADDLDLKKLIRDFSAGIYPADPLQASLSFREGTTTSARLRFDATRLENEDCVQMLVMSEPASDGSNTADAIEVPEPVVAPVPTPGSVEEVTPAEPEVSVEPALTPEPVAAASDPLTGLLFRGDFVRRIDAGVSGAAEPARGAVVYFEPDQPRGVMQDLSVAEMDRFVAACGQVIQSSLADNEFACRFGDAAFLAYVQRGHRREIEPFADRIRGAIKQDAFAVLSRQVPNSCSVGFAQFDPHSQDAETAIAHARQAWQQAREAGDSLVCYRPARGEMSSEQQENAWVERIRYALDNGDFYTIQNPIMHLEGDGDAMTENRTVMRDEASDQDVSFQPSAERNGLASRIDRHILPGLLRAIADGDERQVVSISGNSLQDFSFSSWFRRQLQESGVAGERVFLQLDANMAQEHTKAARRLMDELATTGCGLSLSGVDDSTRMLDLIGELNPSLVRVETALSAGLGEDADSVERIRRIVSEASEHSCAVYVNNVRSSSELALLWQCGVKLVAGEFLEGSSKVIGA